MIKTEIVAYSTNIQGDELISVLCTFPRIILAEVNTHRMLSKNTSSSRAIPFKKMVEAVQTNPFIPIAWQKEHSGMQGNEYITESYNLAMTVEDWLQARDAAVKYAERLSSGFENELFETEQRVDKVTKQLCNRLLEPFMWTTMLITGSKEGWDNFFHLRCPQYFYEPEDKYFKSKNDWMKYFDAEFQESHDWVESRDYFWWAALNKGQAEIHMMALAEKIWDSVNESTPKLLQPGQWHIPFRDKISDGQILSYLNQDGDGSFGDADYDNVAVQVSTSMGARTSYTIVGEEKEINIETLIGLHDRLITQQPPHSSPMEHCSRAMSDHEWNTFFKRVADYDTVEGYSLTDKKGMGWCYNIKGFIPYRYLLDNNLTL